MRPTRPGQVFRHIIPANLTPAQRRCLVIYVPDDWEWITTFWGTFSTLIYWWNFERDPDHKGTIVSQVWRDVYHDARERFLRHECGEGCPEPEPEQPKPLPPPDMAFGSLTGLSIEELEYFYLMFSLRGQLKFINGSLHYYDPGCCDWVKVEGENNTTVLSQAEIVALGQSTMGLSQWDDAGQPDLGQLQDPVPSSIIEYNTSDSLKCAKASAFAEVIHQLFVDVRDGLEESSNSAAFWGGVLQGTITILSAGTWGFIQAGIRSVLGAYVFHSKATTVSELNDVLNNVAGWNDLVCELVPLMEPTFTIGLLSGNKATEKDWSNVVATVKEIFSPGASVNQILDTFPIIAIQAEVRARLSDQECNCGQYLPAGYIPPSQSGAINFTEIAYSGTVNSSAPFPGVTGNPDAALLRSPDQGQKLASNEFRTVYTGADSAGGQANVYSTLCILLSMPEGTEIDQIKCDIDVVNVPAGAIAQEIGFNAVVLRDDTDVWEGASSAPSFALVDVIDKVFNETFAAGSKMALFFQTRNTNNQVYIKVSNLRFTGNRSGAGFLDAALGTQLP